MRQAENVAFDIRGLLDFTPTTDDRVKYIPDGAKSVCAFFALLAKIRLCGGVDHEDEFKRRFPFARSDRSDQYF